MKNDTLYNLAQGIIMKKLRFYIRNSRYSAEKTDLRILYA